MVRMVVGIVWLVVAVNAWLLWANFGSRTWHLAAALSVTYASLWGLFFAASSLSRRKKMQRLLATTLMGFMLLGMFELVAVVHIIDYRKLLGGLAHPNRRPWDNPANLLDKKLLHLHRPNTRHRGRVLGNIARYWQLPGSQHYHFDVQYDSHGFRNRQIHTKAEIIVIGDSFVEGALVSAEENLTSQLQQRLEKPVCNLGQSAYGPQQELEVLRRFGVPLQPKWCVWLFYEGNDLNDAADYANRVAQWKDFMRQRDRFWNRSFTRNFLGALPKLIVRPRPRREFWNQLATVNEETVYFMHAGRALTEIEQTGMEETLKVLQEAADVCRRHEVQLLFAFIPNKFRVYQPLSSFPAESVCDSWQLNELPGTLRQRIKKSLPKVKFIDLTEPLRTVTQAGEATYFHDDTHWTPRGHAAVAAAIAKVLTPIRLQ